MDGGREGPHHRAAAAAWENVVSSLEATPWGGAGYSGATCIPPNFFLHGVPADPGASVWGYASVGQLGSLPKIPLQVTVSYRSLALPAGEESLYSLCRRWHNDLSEDPSAGRQKAEDVKSGREGDTETQPCSRPKEEAASTDEEALEAGRNGLAEDAQLEKEEKDLGDRIAEKGDMNPKKLLEVHKGRWKRQGERERRQWKKRIERYSGKLNSRLLSGLKEQQQRVNGES